MNSEWQLADSERMPFRMRLWYNISHFFRTNIIENILNLKLNIKNTYDGHKQDILSKRYAKIEPTWPLRAKKIVFKRQFLKKLPYLIRVPEDQRFISSLIKKKTFLNKTDQLQLIDYFDVRNKHWAKNTGDFAFDVWVLFTSPEDCKIFDQALIDKSRIKIIPRLTRFYVGSLKKSILNYAAQNNRFNELYMEQINQDDYKHR
jgi:hypothetical protein